MSYYQCKRCMHTTKQKIEMQRHLNRKVKCIRTLESYKFTDEQIIEFSLQIQKKNQPEIGSPITNDSLDISFDKPLESYITKQQDSSFIKPLESSITKQPDSIDFSIEEEITIQKKNLELVLHNDYEEESIRSDYFNKFECVHCKKEFTRKSSLARHIKYRCKEKNNIHEQNITNITNNNNTIIINVNINKPLPFDEDWDVSKIDSTLKHLLLFSDLKYTKTLEAILENEVNLNVIIEDTEDCGIVYKNDIEKFTPMKMEDIIHLSMNKLHKHLKNFHDEVKNDNPYEINPKLLEAEKEMIDRKYKNFKNNAHTQKMVKNFIADIFNRKKEDTLRICNDLMEKNSGY